MAWIKAGAANVFTDVAELGSAMDSVHVDSPDGSGIVPEQTDPVRIGPSGMIGNSRPMRDVLAAIRMVGDRQCSVLIEGETGTGKEVVAREIHATGGRCRGPWVAVNRCV